jgi:DNA-binding XRE family transcriptional regulator
MKGSGAKCVIPAIRFGSTIENSISSQPPGTERILHRRSRSGTLAQPMSARILSDARLQRSVGDAIRQRRSECGLSREDLAHLSSLHPNSIGRIERGESDASVVLLSFLYFHLQCSGVQLEKEGIFPVRHSGVSVASLPEVSALRPPSLVRLMGEVARGRRGVCGMTLTETASCAGIHLNSLWNFETGLVCPSVTTYFRILRTLEVKSVSIQQGIPVLH